MPASPVENSHFISRSLIKKWKREDNRVMVFDFNTNTATPEGPRAVFVAGTPFPPAIEALLNPAIEQRLGVYLARCERENGGKLLPWTPEVRRVLALAIFTQVARTLHAQGTPDWGLLESIGAASLDSYEAYLREKGVLRAFSLTRESIYFPSTGVVALPLERFNGFFLPLLPQAFVAFLPHGSRPLPWMTDERNVKALSVGVEGAQVILPPGDVVDAVAIHAHRATARQLALGG